MRAQLHPELAIGLQSMRAQTQLEFLMSFWHSTQASRQVRGREERRREEEFHLC